MFLAVEGCIGSGKSTTARLIGGIVGRKVLLENADVHPFLPAFYTDPQRYALETELGFALLHYHQLHSAGTGTQVVTDFSPAKDLIFARMNLAKSDLALFEHVYDSLIARVGIPKVTVYLRVPLDVLWKRVRLRARPYEIGISKDYLQRLSGMYELYQADLGEVVHTIDVASSDSPEFIADRVLSVLQSGARR